MEKWNEIVRKYRNLVTGNRPFLTDRQRRFIQEVNKKCFTRVYMVKPSRHVINRISEMYKESGDG